VPLHAPSIIFFGKPCTQCSTPWRDVMVPGKASKRAALASRLSPDFRKVRRAEQIGGFRASGRRTRSRVPRQCADVRVIAAERFVDDSGNIVRRPRLWPGASACAATSPMWRSGRCLNIRRAAGSKASTAIDDSPSTHATIGQGSAPSGLRASAPTPASQIVATLGSHELTRFIVVAEEIKEHESALAWRAFHAVRCSAFAERILGTFTGRWEF
jgi:hypothetical protein